MASKNRRYTVEDIPVRAIDNGMIILDNGFKVCGVKISPKNIFILDKDTQNGLIANLQNVYNMIDYEFWIIAADRPVDINVYLSQLQVLYNSTQNQFRRKMIMQDINKANQFMSNNVVDTEYYLLFRDKKDDVVQKRVRNLISYFANAGLTAQQVSNEDLRVILDNFLNGGQNTTFGTVVG